MPRIITIAQQKGGAGKTTLAAHLAMAWAGLGTEQRGNAFRWSAFGRNKESGLIGKAKRRVYLLDLDPQESLSDWFRVREERYEADDKLILRQAVGWRLSGELSRARRDADLIVIDTPPHGDTSATRLAVRAADLVIVPTQLSPMDVWASKSTLELIEREGKRAIMVLNRVPPRARLADELMHTLKTAGMPLASAHLGNRIAFASSLMEGKGVTESAPKSLAAAEIRLLAGEVWRKAA